MKFLLLLFLIQPLVFYTTVVFASNSLGQISQSAGGGGTLPGPGGSAGGGGTLPGPGGSAGGGGALPPKGGSGGVPTITPSKSLEDILDDLTRYATGIALAVAGLTIIYAGYLILFAGGDPGKFAEGMRVIRYTIIGIIVIFLSAAIVAIVKRIIIG